MPRPIRAPRRSQHGAMLLEALVALLIFSFGILGVVGLQAAAVQQSTDARYRSEAAQLVDQLIGQMWTTSRTPSALQATFNSCSGSTCTGYASWAATVAEPIHSSCSQPVSRHASTVPWRLPRHPCARVFRRTSISLPRFRSGAIRSTDSSSSPPSSR